MKLFTARRLKICLAILSTLCCVVGCTQSPSAPNSTSSTTNLDRSTNSVTNCGGIKNGSLVSSISANDGVPVYVEAVLSANSLGVQKLNSDGTKAGAALYKVFGISSSTEDTNGLVQNFLSQYIGGVLYMVEPFKMSCVGALKQGGVAPEAQFITAEGRSITEILVERGLIAIDQNGSCGESAIAGCYKSLLGTSTESGGVLTEFLWKPVSDSNGHLAIHSSPGDTTVIVNGETGRNQGGGNGFDSLARFSKAGCSYANPQIQVLDSSGLPLTVNGKTSFTVANPCGRYCLRAGAIVACSK